MWMPTDSRKGEFDHCWMKASRCLSTPSKLPLRPLYWLFRVATTSLHISYINITLCTIWLEKTHLHRCFHRSQKVIGLTNSNTTWVSALIGVWSYYYNSNIRACPNRHLISIFHVEFHTLICCLLVWTSYYKYRSTCIVNHFITWEHLMN